MKKYAHSSSLPTKQRWLLLVVFAFTAGLIPSYHTTGQNTIKQPQIEWEVTEKETQLRRDLAAQIVNYHKAAESTSKEMVTPKIATLLFEIYTERLTKDADTPAVVRALKDEIALLQAETNSIAISPAHIANILTHLEPVAENSYAVTLALGDYYWEINKPEKAWKIYQYLRDEAMLTRKDREHVLAQITLYKSLKKSRQKKRP